MRIWALITLGIILVGALPANAQNRDQVTICMALEPPILDPTAGAAQAIKEVTYANIFEGLIGIDRDGKLVPRLAESWTVTPDALTYAFVLRKGATFHDGKGLTSADVKFTFERAVAPDSKNAQKWIFEPIAGIETPDAQTVIVKLKHAAANFLFGLGLGDAVIVSQATAATNATNPVGTGPYKYERWNRGDRLILTRNEAWWGGKAAIQTATFRFISDPQAQLAGIRSGDCDALSNLAAQEAVEQLKKDSRLTVVIGRTEGKTILAINNAKPPFNDVRVRRALSYAIDRKLVIEGAVSGYAVPIGSHFSPNHPAYIDLTGTYPYDPAKARALLAEAGFPQGFSTTLRLPPPAYARRSGEIVAAMLAEVGVKVSIEPLEFPQWLERVFRNKDYDLSIISHTEPLDINIYTRPDYYFQYRSEAFNALVTKAETATDEATRNAAYAEAQKKLAEDAVNVFLFILPKITVTRAGLTGMWPNWPLPANPLAELKWQ